MKKKTLVKAMSVASALVLASSLAAAPLAMAADGATDTKTVKTYQYKQGEATPTYPDTIEVNGKTYKVTSTETVRAASDKVTCGMSETKECTPENLQTTKDSFDDPALYDKDGVTGYIPLKEVTETPVMGTVTYELNRTLEFSGLPTNEVGQIPETSVFTGETGNVVTLTRAGLTFAVESYDERGVPKTYSAVALYRGTDAYETIDHYEVTATWEGEATSSVPVYELRVTYEEDSSIVGVVAGASAGAVVVAGVVIFLFWRRSRFRITEVRDGKEKTLTNIKVQKDASGIAVKIPATLLIDPIAHYGYPPTKYVKQSTNLVIYFVDANGEDKVFYNAPAKDRIPLKL